MSQQSIIQYINLLCNSSITSLSDLSSGEIFCQLISLIQPSKIDKSKIQPIDTWMQKLINLKLAVKYLLIEYQQEHSNRPQLDFDLLKIAKYQDHKQITKVFEAMLYVFLNCQNKDQFIKKIMQMGEDSQHYMMDTVRKLIDTSAEQEAEGPKDSETTERTRLLEKVDQLEHEIEILRSENMALQEQATQEHKQNTLLHKQISKLSENINSLSNQISRQQPKLLRSQVFDNSSLIQSLKQKLITQSVEHQKERMRFNEEIDELREKLQRIDDMETRVENYQHKLTQSSQRIQELEDDLQHSKEDLGISRQLVSRLEQKSRLLEQKFNKEELEKISQQVNLEKSNLRNTNRNEELKRIASLEANRSDPFLEYDSKRQSEEQLSIANRRIKTLEKQLAKATLKAEKAGKLESDKKQLQETFVTELGNKKQEIEIIASALIEVRRMLPDLSLRKQ